MNNKFKFLINGKIEKKNTQQHFDEVEFVHKSISNYLGFDMNRLIADTDAVIFGGAVRDSLAQLDIHDVDIMALSFSARTIANRLVNDFGFYKYSGSDTDTICLYNKIKVIHEPWTFVKDHISVQIIRPCGKEYMAPTTGATLEGLAPDSHFSSALHMQMLKLVSQVDISACGIIYSNNITSESVPIGGGVLTLVNKIDNENQFIREMCPDAKEHCRTKHFRVYPDKLMHQRDRILHRTLKLEQRGWTQIQESKPVEMIDWAAEYAAETRERNRGIDRLHA